jgi:hypothetical protein
VLYASAKGGVSAAKLDPGRPEALQFVQLPSMPADASGLAFDPTPRLYVASRTGKVIYRYVSAGSAPVPSWTADPQWKPLSVQYDPEFLLYVEH